MALTYHPISPNTQQRDLFPQPITALSFDPVSDTLWAGNNSGIIASYYTAQGIRGVTFPVGGDLAVKSIVATDSLVRASGVSSNGIGAWGKGGVNKWYLRTTNPITAFSTNSTTGSVFYACTAGQEFFAINSQTGDVIRRSPTVSIYSHLVHGTNVILSSGSDGYIRSHDPRTSSTVNAVQAHASGVQGLLASGNFICSIGLGTRQGRPFPDPLVKLYDSRNMRPLPPIPFPAGPAFIELLPKRAGTIVVTSPQGLVNIVDVANVTNTEFYQLDTPSYITSTAISPSGTYMAFGDAEGVIQMLTAADEDAILPLNGFEGTPVEWADSPEPYTEIDWTDSTPLNSIGMPYYDNILLSSWTSKFMSSNTLYPPPPKIPQQILTTMKVNDNVAYAPLPKELRGRRNVAHSAPKRSTARFRSGRFVREEPETPTYEYDPDAIPKIYRKIEIEYSKFGVEDFDFGFFNQTEYSGLETHITNSYTNAMLQLLHYTHPIRHLAKSHITTDCSREHCLFCELGFVIRMLEDARGTNCQSSNFCQTVGVLAQKNNLIELMDYGKESADHNYGHMIQAFHRFLVDNLSSEGNSYPHNPWLLPPSEGHNDPAPAPITQLCGIDAKSIITCMNCQAVREKENMTHVVDMVYPRKANASDALQDTDFASILRSSLLRHSSHKATCPSCNKQFSTFDSRRSIATKDLPPILAVNAAAFTEDALRFWRDGRNQQVFLKSAVELQGQINGQDDLETALYELRGFIVQVVTKEKRSHLVGVIKVPEEEDTGAEDESHSPWYLFNDFTVRNISEQEAFSFPGSWKVPTVLYLERVEVQHRLNFSALPYNIDLSLLSQDTNIATKRDKKLIKHELLQPEELPKPGTLVAIDAEFVSMQQEETEYRSDGTKKVLRPARLSLARVSVIRGDGTKAGVPFIDDYIHTSEVIVDYLTEFSGIRFGDLDPHLSKHTLTPLKVVYKKLRLLVDQGCIFIGHGLSKDFRIINIFVPPEQVIDTVDLYFIKARQRRLSLRFLSWYVLKEDIQIDTHDSIEDALSALRLYKAYIKFEAEGTFDQKLEEVYREGKQYNFKPPTLPGPTPTQPQSTPATPAAMIPPQFAMTPGQLLQATFNQPQFQMNAVPPPFFSSSSPYRPQWRSR
ncbi:PAB-dependent poly-A-specific ribonuclease subunit PAN2 [Irpex rosettiformis]|uniref:PAB-dependent poly-A-specific ribonuclease subunit PAN2 n=1 Tax=Irpex rosettiformis TaxID=378272 RepID=A0ACB8UI88_9APHY|nr:PAB-dependent poly-A-specific ribonuclease subunit PAN2 [Irpex rosettiformis]